MDRLEYPSKENINHVYGAYPSTPTVQFMYEMVDVVNQNGDYILCKLDKDGAALPFFAFMDPLENDSFIVVSLSTGSKELVFEVSKFLIVSLPQDRSLFWSISPEYFTHDKEMLFEMLYQNPPLFPGGPQIDPIMISKTEARCLMDIFKAYEKWFMEVENRVSPLVGDRPVNKNFPFEWKGKIPVKIVMTKTVQSDIYSLEPGLTAEKGAEYGVYINPEGLVFAVIHIQSDSDTHLLALQPDEYEVILWE